MDVHLLGLSELEFIQQNAKEVVDNVLLVPETEQILFGFIEFGYHVIVKIFVVIQHDLFENLKQNRPIKAASIPPDPANV